MRTLQSFPAQASWKVPGGAVAASRFHVRFEDYLQPDATVGDPLGARLNTEHPRPLRKKIAWTPMIIWGLQQYKSQPFVGATNRSVSPNKTRPYLLRPPGLLCGTDPGTTLLRSLVT